MSLLLLAVVLFTAFVILNMGFWFGVWWWHGHAQDTYKLAYFFVDDGNQTRIRKGNFIFQDSESANYIYDKNMITIPHTYGYVYFKHRRRIDINLNGTLQYKNNKAPTQSKYNEMIKTLTLGHIGADIINSVSSSKFKMNVVIVAIIALAIGALAMNFFNSTQKSNNTTLPAQTQQSAPQIIPPTGEVK